MKTVIIIPARYASTRFPGKPLKVFFGKDGVQRTLIEHTWRAGLKVAGIDAIYIATDDDRIEKICKDFGAKVIMTSPDRRNGTERCAEAITKITEHFDIVINLQGDAPLTPHWFIEALIETLYTMPEVEVATPVLKCDSQTLHRLLNDRSTGSVGGTTAVFNKFNHALYFSKEVIPFGQGKKFHHVGVYAYRTDALNLYLSWPEGSLEKSEGLEQLRFLENGQDLKCVEVDAKGKEFWEVNNPEDISIVEKMLGISDE